ncbi:Mitochondrial import inner membrane translocase subunit Tim17 family protein [Sarocladium implicatum]|nr:Mitochondrial import inner membrane translocase subunit Tim17 family protein [Sarocladium implicatum]
MAPHEPAATPLPPPPQAPYVAHDTINETGKSAIVGFGSGLLAASVQNALSRRNVGAFSVFTRGAPLIGIATFAPAAYTFVSRTAMNLREEESSLAAALGGFACGGVLGLPYRRLPIVMGLGGFVGAMAGTLHLFGGRIDTHRVEEDEFARKEILRRTTRLPVEQTIAELGEGPEIRGPGYEERRRERLKEKFGVEINPVKATVEGN